MMMMTDLPIPDHCNGDKRVAAGQKGITFQENNQAITFYNFDLQSFNYNFFCTLQEKEMNTTHLRVVIMSHLLISFF